MTFFISATPMGQLPVLEVEGGHTIAQSVTIARYLARRYTVQCALT